MEKVAPRPKGSAVVRTSKYRHLFGTPLQNNECIGSVKSGSVQTESNVLKVNATFYGVPWCIPGTVAVVPIKHKGSVSADLPLIIHDETTVNDFAFNPFNDHMLATACQDGTVAIWQIPKDFTSNLTKPARAIATGDKRVLSVDFHPLASDVLYSFDAAKQIRFWDITEGKEKFALPDVHKALPTNISWNLDGSLCASSCKDKMLRIFDPRSNKCTSEVPDHQGVKGGRVLWMRKKNLIFTCGFAKGSDRSLSLFDPRKMDQKLTTQTIDTSSSSLMPFYDEDNSVLFLAGKGDGNVRYYEIVDEEPFVFYMNEYKSKDPQSGMAMLPKSSCEVMKCEIARLVKLTPQGGIVPIRFEVPRADAQFFQEDLFPDTFDLSTPSLGSSEWFSGSNGGPKFKSMKP